MLKMLSWLSWAKIIDTPVPGPVLMPGALASSQALARRSSAISSREA
jgi:hypothetical protein